MRVVQLTVVLTQRSQIFAFSVHKLPGHTPELHLHRGGALCATASECLLGGGAGFQDAFFTLRVAIAANGVPRCL